MLIRWLQGCVIVTCAVLLGVTGGYFYLGREFECPSSQEFNYPRVDNKHGGERALALIEYVEHYNTLEDFPDTEDGIRNLKKLFIVVWAIQPDLLFGLMIDTECPLYKKLKSYYPELDSKEIPTKTKISINSIVDCVINRKPSKIRFIVMKLRGEVNVQPKTHPNSN